MSDAELKNTTVTKSDWENELWSLLNISDGTNCPLYNSCQYRKNNRDCLSRNRAYAEAIHRFVDRDTLALPPARNSFPKIPNCVDTSRIFELVRKLAQRYTEKMGVPRLPVAAEIIKNYNLSEPVEVRLVPLKAAHGAVWHLKDGWVIHLNSRDSSARRRFTLYHELFHILAHHNATPVFKKASTQPEGAFNELLADHFSGVMIMPEEMVRIMWPEVRDVGKMSKIFDVPESIMFLGLKHMKMI